MTNLEKKTSNLLKINCKHEWSEFECKHIENTKNLWFVLIYLKILEEICN